MEHRWVYVRKSSIIENQKIFRQKTLKFGPDTIGSWFGGMQLKLR